MALFDAIHSVDRPSLVTALARAMASAGEKAERVIEVHLLDFHRDIYGADIEIKFMQFLRPEKKFESVEALGQQIAADVKKARELCAV